MCIYIFIKTSPWCHLIEDEIIIFTLSYFGIIKIGNSVESSIIILLIFLQCDRQQTLM